MHTFQINILIHFLASSTHFEHHVFSSGRQFVHAVLCGMFFIHLCKQLVGGKMYSLEHIIPHTKQNCV